MLVRLVLLEMDITVKVIFQLDILWLNGLPEHSFNKESPNI